MRRATRPLAFALAIGLAPSAFAQDGEIEPVQPAEEAAEAPSPKDETKGKAPFPRISDKEETIYAIQRKAYLVDSKIELTPMAAASFTDRFIQTFAPAGSLSYHVAENFALELYGAYMFPDESGLTEEILNKGKLTPEIAKLTQMLWTAGVGVQWSPIYGKVQLFGASLGNFNFYLGAGAGVGQTRVQCTPGTMLDPNRGFDPAECPAIQELPDQQDVAQVVYEPATLEFMGSFSGGVRFYFSNTIGLKFEVKDYIFAARVFRPETTEPTQRFTDAIRNNIYAQLGVSFLFGGEEN